MLGEALQSVQDVPREEGEAEQAVWRQPNLCLARTHRHRR